MLPFLVGVGSLRQIMRWLVKFSPFLDGIAPLELNQNPLRGDCTGIHFHLTLSFENQVVYVCMCSSNLQISI